MSLRYIGTREIVTGLDARYPQTETQDDRFTVVDDVTWTPAGAYVDRVDDLDFTPADVVSQNRTGVFGRLAPEVERRTQRERHVWLGSHDAIEVDQRSVTTDQPPAAENVRTMGVSQDYLLTTVYARPPVTFAFSGAAFLFKNSTQRQVFNGAAGGLVATTVGRDGAIEESVYGNARFTQAADGSAHYNSGVPGFYSNDLVVDAPTDKNGVKTIHSIRTTSGRTVGTNPVTTTDVAVPNWYPGGRPGSSDMLRVAGLARMPESCERPLGSTAGFESIETFSETRATGEITTDVLRTYTRGTNILCTIEEKRVRIFDTATGALAQTSTDSETLRLTTTPPAVSLSLVADHEPTFGYGADRHAVGANVLTIGTGDKKTVALRFSPASIDGDPDAAVSIEPEIAKASLGEQGSIAVTAGPTPGKAVLQVRSPKAGGSKASIPIFVYRRVEVACNASARTAIVFDDDGEVFEAHDPAQADIRIDCSKGQYGTTVFFPLGATAIHTDVFATDTFASVKPDAWSARAISFDGSSVFAGFLRTPGNDHDEAQDILLVKTHNGLIVKILCARGAAFSLRGMYAVTSGDTFPY